MVGAAGGLPVVDERAEGPEERHEAAEFDVLQEVREEHVVGGRLRVAAVFVLSNTSTPPLRSWLPARPDVRRGPRGCPWPASCSVFRVDDEIGRVVEAERREGDERRIGKDAAGAAAVFGAVGILARVLGLEEQRAAKHATIVGHQQRVRQARADGGPRVDVEVEQSLGQGRDVVQVTRLEGVVRDEGPGQLPLEPLVQGRLGHLDPGDVGIEVFVSW